MAKKIINPEEKAASDYYNTEYYKKIDSSKPLSHINWWSVRYRENLLLRLFNGKHICDVGCGPGFYVAYCASQGIQIDGVDISQKVIAYCKKHIHNAGFATCDVERQKLHTAYEGIYSFDVIEHIFDYDSFLKNIHDSLEPGGVVLLSTPNVLAPQNRLKFLLGYGIPFGDKEHVHFFTPSLIEEALRHAGFRGIRIFGTGKLAWLSTSLSGNIYIIGRK